MLLIISAVSLFILKPKYVTSGCKNTHFKNSNQNPFSFIMLSTDFKISKYSVSSLPDIKMLSDLTSTKDIWSYCVVHLFLKNT